MKGFECSDLLESPLYLIMKESSTKLNNLAFETIQKCFSQMKSDKLAQRYKGLLIRNKPKDNSLFKIIKNENSSVYKKKNLELLSNKNKGFENGAIPKFIEAYLFLSVGNDGRAYKILSNLIKRPLNSSIFEKNASSISLKEYQDLDLIIEYFYSKLKKKFVDLICARLISIDYYIYSGEQVESCSHIKESDLARFIYSPNYGKRFPSLWLNTPFNLSKKNRDLFFQQSSLYKEMKNNDLSSWLVFQKYKLKSKKERELLRSFIINKNKKSDLYMDVLFRLSQSENRFLLKQLGYSEIFSLNKRRSFYLKLLRNKRTYVYGLINLILLNDYSLDHINSEYLQ